MLGLKPLKNVQKSKYNFFLYQILCVLWYIEYHSILVNIFLVKQQAFCCYNLLSCFDIILCNDLSYSGNDFFGLLSLCRQWKHVPFDSQYAHHDFTYYENYQPTSSNAGIYYLCNILSNNLFVKSSILKSDSYFCIIIIIQDFLKIR